MIKASNAGFRIAELPNTFFFTLLCKVRYESEVVRCRVCGYRQNLM